MPSSQSPQSQAIEVVNAYLAEASKVLVIHDTLKNMAARWTDDNVANTLAQFHTVPVNLDGSLSTVNDVNTTSTNPMNPALYPTLTRPVSSLQVAQIKTILDGLVAYLEGQAVGTQPGARAILNAVIGG